jgi:hypothetical protein
LREGPKDLLPIDQEQFFCEPLVNYPSTSIPRKGKDFGCSIVNASDFAVAVYGTIIKRSTMNSLREKFLQHDWIFPERLLEEMETSVPTSAPGDSTNQDGSGGDSVNTDNDSLLADKEGVMRFGIVLLAALVVILVFIGWRSFKYWKLRRERYMLQVQSNRADAVLGDMQVCGW